MWRLVVLVAGIHACPYSSISARHTLCVASTCKPLKAGISNYDKKHIVRYHNEWRSKLAQGKVANLPQGANIRHLEWDPELAKVAQAHASQCKFAHDCQSCRRLPRFSTGQNLFSAWTLLENDVISNWTTAMEAWFDESNVTPSNIVDSYAFGASYAHFTQAVWAKTYLIGCGFSTYVDGRRYVRLYTCNYGPSGNVWGQRLYKTGKPCSRCPKRTKCFKDLLCR